MLAKNENGICLTATRGLYFFRKGLHDIGRQLYLESIQMAKDSGNVYLNSLALVNYIREEILLGEEDLTEIIPHLNLIAKHYEGKSIADDANEVLELFYSKEKKEKAR